MTHIVEKPMVCLAIGLALLIGGQLWPLLPVVSGVALIACGACLVALKRTPVTPLLLVSQLLVYSSLVALFLGARLHTASLGNAPLGPIDVLDISFATLLMAIAFKQTLGSLLPSGDAH